MRPKLGLVILVLVAVSLLFCTRDERRRERTAEPAASGAAAAAEKADLAAPAAALEPPPVARVEVERAAAAEATAPVTAPATSANLFRLRGTLRHSTDLRPAAQEEVIFHFGEEYTRVVTDAAGRFETEAVVPRGAVRAWHTGVNLPIEPETFLAEPSSADALTEVELVLVDPAAWLEVEVVTLGGIRMAAELRWRFHPGEVTENSRVRAGRSPTDAHGRARLPVPVDAPGARLSLLARAGDELVSDIVQVEAPLPKSPVQLVLDGGGSIHARVVAGTVPLVGARLTLRATDFSIDDATTDAAGLAVFDAVTPGLRQLDFWHAETSRWIDAVVEVERGRTSEVELAVTSLPLAVAGRVVDENGAPLEGIRIVVFLEDHSTTTHTYGNGAFSVASPGSGSVRVSTEPELGGDRYEPAALEVPFGTSDILIRRLPTLPATSLAVEILERGTLTRIQEAMVLGFVNREDWSFHRAPDGVVALQLKLYEDAWLAVEAVGYRRVEVRAADLVRAGPEGGPYRVLLERGLERSLRIFDEADGTPVLGALVFDGERLVATADGDGLARIELSLWPAALRIQAAGHADSVWNCKDWLAELGDGNVWLTRLPEGAAQAGR